MQCINCERTMPGEATFCTHCGTRLVEACRQCKSTNPANNKFCHACGSQLAEPTTLKRGWNFFTGCLQYITYYFAGFGTWTAVVAFWGQLDVTSIIFSSWMLAIISAGTAILGLTVLVIAACIERLGPPPPQQGPGRPAQFMISPRNTDPNRTSPYRSQPTPTPR